MLWIFQQNFYSERNYELLVETVARAGIPWVRVKPVPFTYQLLPYEYDTSKASDLSQVPEPEIDTSKGVVVFGSYTLAKIALNRGWSPGAWIENLRYDVWSKAWPEHCLLNPGAKIQKFEDVELTSSMFVRPVEDSKAFAGKVFDQHAWEGFKRDALKSIDATEGQAPLLLNRNTEVLVSSPVEIWTETRLFVVDGRVVTGSVYKRGQQVIYDDYLDSEVLDFAQSVISHWVPSRAFVLDIAITPNAPKIVELNCLNAAGFYACNVNKIVEAIEGLG